MFTVPVPAGVSSSTVKLLMNGLCLLSLFRVWCRSKSLSKQLIHFFLNCIRNEYLLLLLAFYSGSGANRPTERVKSKTYSIYPGKEGHIGAGSGASLS